MKLLALIFLILLFTLVVILIGANDVDMDAYLGMFIIGFLAFLFFKGLFGK